MRQRLHFAIARRFVDPKHLVFLDESSAKTNMTRLYGRALGGARCHDTTAHGHWKTLTMLSAIRLSGVVRNATQVFDAAMNAYTFRGYVQRCLSPSLQPGDVVIMDNLSSHKAMGVAEAIASVGATLWYLPPYSPDLNPIEKLWSKVKTSLRDLRATTTDRLIDAIAQVLRTVSASECQNYFASCGYEERLGEVL